MARRIEEILPEWSVYKKYKECAFIKKWKFQKKGKFKLHINFDIYSIWLTISSKNLWIKNVSRILNSFLPQCYRCLFSSILFLVEHFPFHLIFDGFRFRSETYYVLRPRYDMICPVMLWISFPFHFCSDLVFLTISFLFVMWLNVGMGSISYEYVNPKVLFLFSPQSVVCFCPILIGSKMQQ